ISNVSLSGLSYSGAYTGPEDKSRRLVEVFNGVAVSLLAYSYGFNGFKGPAREEGWKLGFLDNDEIMEDMAEARRQGADFVIVSLHFGNEYQRLPSVQQKELISRVLAGDPENGLPGADLILGHHPHVVQPFTAQVSPAQDQLAIYSLGNFISNQNRTFTNLGVILDCLLTIEPSGRKTISKVRLRPTLCYNRYWEGRRIFRIIPLEEAAANPDLFEVLDANIRKKTAQYQKEMEQHLWKLLGPRLKKPEVSAAAAGSGKPGAVQKPGPAGSKPAARRAKRPAGGGTRPAEGL
ncbi:MAG: CapA family protein, partial [Deltaproteobacteria bacterium]|nr:CapA family protein [Deltaproteobacteria bacterium]